MKTIKSFFYLLTFLIVWPMIGYNYFLILLDKLIKLEDHPRKEQTPKVSLIIPAHNEEKVILKKLENLMSLDYPNDKIEIIVANDNSNDSTANIVESFINSNPKFKTRLYNVVERKGKTNAQNEAVKTTDCEILVFTDANSMLDQRAIQELVSSFYDDSIMYVSGDLVYTNAADNPTSDAENTYWNLDKKIRNIESNLSSITAGNGALYAIRKDLYVEVPLIHSHDSKMPKEAVLRGYKAITNNHAIAYEKAGENDEDEYKRKVRMNRVIFESIFESLFFINIFKYKFFTIQMLSHRTLRYLLAINHILLFIINTILVLKNPKLFYKLSLFLQTLFYVFAIIGRFNPFKLFKLPYYYCMTLVAQLHGMMNYFTGKRKPFWEKAESTR
ncbi:glycosyltransferase family 2 protein [Macrococcus capreoli]|uniref:glycosyltransferase family 2 protein n=1 Tax=Macrococcus capreoli TaxID=2982690 RepID=UPI0021D5CFCB|nr:glycosyltransferase family 2 protein [Macrococcus sp. TMW 2.2395]MCU7557549.1 glycosyltransferase family 2 protein [Macrococcus sp. TMW 2.2395]